MDGFFDDTATHLGDQVSGDHIKLVACIMVTCPLALIYRKLPAESPTSRHLFSIYLCFYFDDLRSETLYGIHSYWHNGYINLYRYEILSWKKWTLY